MILAGLVSAWATSTMVIAVGQALLGSAQLTAAISVQMFTANRRRSNRDRGFARLAVAVSLGQLTGPLLAGFLLDAPRVPLLNELPRTVTVCLVASLLATLALLVSHLTQPGREPGGLG